MITFDYLNFILSEAKKSKEFVGPRMSGSYDRYFLPFHADIESKWEKFNFMS